MLFGCYAFTTNFMTIIPKTQTEKDIQIIEDASATFSNAVNAAIFTLNLAYDALWKLPDDRLVAVLQRLYDAGKLMELFTDHNFSAVNLNEIQDKAQANGPRAIAVAGREFTIVDGVISLVPLPLPEPPQNFENTEGTSSEQLDEPVTV